MVCLLPASHNGLYILLAYISYLSLKESLLRENKTFPHLVNGARASTVFETCVAMLVLGTLDIPLQTPRAAGKVENLN